ncbi:hypothetical protein DW1_1847 [Proteiniborus sp. DW1]|uniref:hypothetical protein n=1 Tax=Proteiniborus sp. DW1 TaxID=1889883 RepID=UPI00092E0187|nr:hypothetical protein [Proteiniborus sp. DW1]SCG83415.1 hypothetical protein DW1_1847 [Proteiniborus sp. DW1]
MSKYDIIGFPLEEGLNLLKKQSSNKIEIKGTTADRKLKEPLLFEPRIVRCTDTGSIITVVVSYF